MDGESCNIRVICRFRPVNSREKAEGGGIAKQLEFSEDGKSVSVAPHGGRPGNVFNFDAVFHDPSTTQKQVYDNAANESICDVINGYNSTIFAYGQTGAGKSFTMFGDIIKVDLKGIIPRACMHIFHHIESDTEGTEYTIKCSFLEIYKEIVRDLLNPAANTSTKGLRVRDAPGRGVWVDGLHEAYVTCEEDVLELIQQGESHRATSSTDMNATSSRSHSLFILSLHQKTRDGSTKEGKLNLADLAGSEKVGKTGATGNTLEEAKKINQSLSALGNCINALTKTGQKHIPYRDSKLTHILRESLGGNCKSTLLVAASPHIFNLEETVSTLMFAKRAKTIKNSVKINKKQSVEELMAIIQKLKRELMYFKKYVAVLEAELEKVKGPNWKDDLPKLSSVAPSKPKASSKPAATATPSTPTAAKPAQRASTPTDDESEEEEEVYDTEEQPMDEEERVYSTSAEMSIKFAGLQVELKKVKEQAHVDIQNLKEELKSLTEDNEGIEQDLKMKAKLIDEKSSTIKSLHTEMDSLMKKNAAAEEKLVYDIKKLTLKEEEQQLALDALSNHNSNFKIKVNELNQELEDMTSEKDRLHREQDRLHREGEEIKEELNRKQEQVLTLETSLEEVTQTYQSLREQNTQQEIINKSIGTKLEIIEEKYSQLQTSSRDLESKLRVALNENVGAERTIADLRSDVASLGAEVKATAERLQETKEVKQAVQEAGQERIEELLTRTVPLQDYDRVVKEKETFRSSISSLKEKLNHEQMALSNLRGELEETGRAYEAEKEQIKEAWHLDKETREQQLDALERKYNELEESKQTKIQAFTMQIELITSQLDVERTAKQKLETDVENLYEKNAGTEKALRKVNLSLEEQRAELETQTGVVQSQARSLEAQNERIKQLETELEEQRQDKEILQQEVQSALEINIENAKQFEQQLTSVREEVISSPQMRRKQNIRVPVGHQANENKGFFASVFGIRSYPTLGEIKNPLKFGYMLKRSDWLKKWEQRWFVLSHGFLHYFEGNNQATKATGEILLDGVRLVPADEVTGRPNTLAILHRTRKEYYLAAPNAEELRDWVKNIQIASKGKKKQAVKLPAAGISQSAPRVNA